MDRHSFESPLHLGEWSTPSVASSSRQRTPRRSTSTDLVKSHPTSKPELSLLRQKILTEEEYTQGLSDVIKRSFFPQLEQFEARDALIRAVESEDVHAIEESARRMREIITPSSRRRSQVLTPGRTPLMTEPSYTPTPTYDYGSSPYGSPSTYKEHLRYDPSLSLDAFQSTYTSEDNASFSRIVEKDNLARKEKYKWAYEAERKANAKAIRGREARERLVDLTREMVASNPDGIVKMIEGAPGRPGERKVVVNPGSLSGEGSQLMVEGASATHPLRITDGGKTGVIPDKGKQKEGLYIDYEKPTAEEEEEYAGPRADETDVPVEGFLFTNRNSLMFAPDANGDVKQTSDQDTLYGEPKGIRYHATRLDEAPRKSSDHPSPTRSRIEAAVTGTPYPATQGSSTPKVAGFSFVDALPTPRASSIDSKSLEELMTWGTLEGTPRTLSRTSLDSSTSPGPFSIKEDSNREKLAHRMANKAKRSLADRNDRSIGRSTLRRAVLDRGDFGSERSARAPASPRSGSDLSPAARSLLHKTGKMAKGMGDSNEFRDSEAARLRARELESRQRLKRKRWSPSPAPGTPGTPGSM